MASACPFALPPDTVVTSVPMTKKHLNARGIDHGRLLAEAFAQRRNLPCQPLLIRTRETATQQGLNAAQRRKNLHGAFAAAARISTPVLLIDDVYTTGSTTETCADALRAAGAPDVFVLTALAVVPDEDH
jgi:predicted amidophosphoribosyltransferase